MLGPSDVDKNSIFYNLSLNIPKAYLQLIVNTCRIHLASASR